MAEEQKTIEKTKKEKKPMSKRKKLLIVFGVILGVLVLLLPLASLSYGKISELFFGKKEVSYYEPDYKENIWENEEYLSYKGTKLSVTVVHQSPFSYSYDFHDMDSAEKAFSKAAEAGDGAEVLKEYFLSLLSGSDSLLESERFASCFTEHYKETYRTEEKEELPAVFPAQKVYNIEWKYFGERVEDGVIKHEWHLSFDVVRNDGTVLNYTNMRDRMEGRFIITEQSGKRYLIDEIIPIHQMN